MIVVYLNGTTPNQRNDSAENDGQRCMAGTAPIIKPVMTTKLADCYVQYHLLLADLTYLTLWSNLSNLEQDRLR